MPTAPTRRPRPTIGILAGWQAYEGTTPNWFLEALLLGVMEAGRTLDCDLLLSCGVGPGIADPRAVRPAWPEVLPDGDFVPVGSWNTDGLVVISPLRTIARRGYVRRLQDEGHPVVYIGEGDGRPAVVADSFVGIRQALLHLREHGHREVVYVGGDPLDDGDSRTRLEAFHAVAGELGLDHGESCTEPGFHSEPGGYAAMKALLERGCRFTAVLASNDNSALGAMRALVESGRRVPDDVAVVGFDDQPWAAGHIPPLTTIRYPLGDAGKRAVELLLEMIQEGSLRSDEVRVPTRLVGRRSCGCLPREGARRAGSIPAPDGAVAAPGAEGPRSGTVRAMTDALGVGGSSLAAPDTERLCAGLFAGFETSLAAGKATAFEHSLLELVRELEESGDPAHLWQTALSVLRAGLLDTRGAAGLAGWAEDLLHLGRVVLSESAERQGGRQRLLDSEYEDKVSELSVRLLSVHEETELPAVLGEHAPALGIHPTLLALYEPAGDDPVASCRILLSGPGGAPEEPTAPEPRETTRALTFDRLFPESGPRCQLVLPLIHKGRSPGFVAFATDTLDPCAAVARQLAVALESVRLQAAVRALTLRDDLTGLYNRRFFESELKRETERSRRFRHDVALVMLDLDHFKAYNDSFGHRAGDDALRRVAERIVSSTHRKLDAIVRYGGEEFAILLAETDLDGARQVAERFREAIEGCTDFLRPLTVSAGVAALHGEGCDGERLVLDADRALYQAKKEGRNRVCLAPPSS
ncbi:MAG: GGDEF domain-containing protein [Acidobacteria bacterium]|nr:GGDEF domain-containing protein [Acidobacteriota bacterium]